AMNSEQFINDSASAPTGWTVKQLIDCTEDKLISYGIVQPGQHVEAEPALLFQEQGRNSCGAADGSAGCLAGAVARNAL
ncbi:MAG: hypothetical protein ACPH26_09345, partial [Candidatus Puniceispirillaceae bacterium]